MSPPHGVVPIGRLARLARLTVKALRHYAAEGLLEPAWTDPSSGYRYYRAEQVRTAATIALLRSLDVPLPVVRRVLAAADPDAVAAVLAEERARLAAELARREVALRSIDRLLAAPEGVRYDVAVAGRAPVRITGATGRATAGTIDVDVSGLCGVVLEQVARAGRPVAGPLVGVFPLDLADEFAVSVGVPGGDGPDGVALPGGPWASTLHVGPYAELALAYAALLEHVRERGHEPVGPATETYLTDPGRAAPEELVTRVSVALAEEGVS